VGSYICQAWRRFDLRVSGYRPVLTTVCAVLIYANFYTHHWIVDLRIPLAVLMLVVCRRTWVFYTVGPKRYRMLLVLSFLLIGFFLWLAENAGTFLDAWNYPDQVDVWRLVHPAKFGAWSLLVSMSFVLVATVKGLEGRLYHRGVPATVVTPRATAVAKDDQATLPGVQLGRNSGVGGQTAEAPEQRGQRTVAVVRLGGRCEDLGVQEQPATGEAGQPVHHELPAVLHGPAGGETRGRDRPGVDHRVAGLVRPVRGRHRRPEPGRRRTPRRR
jgi:hypothetical protein